MEDKEKQGLFKKIGSKWAEIRENVSNKIHSAKETIKEKFTKMKTKIVVSVGGIVLAGAMAITAIVSCGNNEFNINDLNDNNNNDIQYETTIDGEIIEVITPGDNENPGVDKPGVDKPGVETSGIVTPDNGGSVQNIKKDMETYLLNNPEYKELIQKAVDDYEFSKTAYFDPHPYSYLEKKGYDVEAIKNGTIECETVSYVLEEKPSSLFIATKVLNTDRADHILLEYNLSDKEMEIYEDMNSHPYTEAAFINDALGEFKNPVSEKVLRMSTNDSKGIDASLEHYGKYLQSNSTITFVIGASEESQTFDCVIIPKFNNRDKKSKKITSVGFATFDSVEPIVAGNNNYYTLPSSFNRMMELDGKAVPGTVYNLQDLNWSYSSLDYQQNQ